MFIISDTIAETWFLCIIVGHLGFFIIGRRKQIETVFICSVGIYSCEKSSSIKINMNITPNFDMLHSEMYYNIKNAYYLPANSEENDTILTPPEGYVMVVLACLFVCQQDSLKSNELIFINV